MPTYNRRAFVPHSIRYFLRQDYTHKELIIIDDGTDSIEDLIPFSDNIRYFRLKQKITLGAKLNLACQYANGKIIANWDDDDWYAPRRLRYQIETMQHPGIEVCGINKLLYYGLQNQQAYQYIYPADQRIWLLGSSLCFTKALWQSNQFADIDVGMDGLFVWATAPERVKALEDYTFSVHMIHPHNVSPKKTDGSWWYPHPVENLQKIMGADWEFYRNWGENPTLKSNNVSKLPTPSVNGNSIKILKNIFACLVHEKEDCILDLVRNLHFHDPSSIILLYNGGTNPNLLQNKFLFEPFGVAVHPNPKPQHHGYLHTFALDCMAYALEHFSFDTFTIVDSDQLCIRAGYSHFLTDFFAASPETGMLSSVPERVTREHRTNWVALQAFREYDLWKPFLEGFPDGDSKFVHWTFWPSTVFSYPAIRDLVQLFQENKLLQNIIKQTKIWATEEVIFPTLVRLLGYKIAENPCSYEYVRYRHSYTQMDINNALERPNVFWIHPVRREFTDSVRQYIRRRFEEYTLAGKVELGINQTATSPISTATFGHIHKEIEGWLSDAEADLLLSIAEKALKTLPVPHHIVEIGSYHGKSTLLLGRLVNEYFPKAKIHAIDPHDGKLGAADQAFYVVPPSFENFKKNIHQAGLTEVVDMIKSTAQEVVWEKSIAVLLIDGLHDYSSVSKDFCHFSQWITRGGYILFHDYAHYFPGVKAFVNELLATGTYQKVQLVDSLMVVQKMI